MSRGTILGYAIASPEKQRRTALVVLAVTVMLLGGAYGAFVGPHIYRSWIYERVAGRVTALEDKCTYSIRGFGRRGARTYLTDLVSCEEAYAKAAEVDHAMGDVRHYSVVHVAYTPIGGDPTSSSFDMPAEAATDLRVGQSLALMHHPEYVHRVERVPFNSFALTHAGRYGVAARAPAVEDVQPAAGAAPPRKRFQLAKPGEEVSTIEKVSRVIAWIIVALMGAAILAAPWLVWKLARRLFGKPVAAKPQAPQRAPSARRLADATRPRTPAVGRPPRISLPR